jgi:hypothetical protein
VILPGKFPFLYSHHLHLQEWPAQNFQSSSFRRIIASNPKPVKKPVFIFIAAAVSFIAKAQPSNDTAKLVQQKENVITTNTIIKVENIGRNINSGCPN